jgi:hypothetical protein
MISLVTDSFMNKEVVTPNNEEVVDAGEAKKGTLQTNTPYETSLLESSPIQTLDNKDMIPTL